MLISDYIVDIMVHNIKIKWPDPLGRICAANQSYGSSIKSFSDQPIIEFDLWKSYGHADVVYKIIHTVVRLYVVIEW